MPNASIEKRQEKDKESVVEALKEMPIAQIACKKAGISRATYYRWRSEDRIFRRSSDDALAQGIDYINDMSESQLVSLIKDKKMPAIAMWLRHNHVRYGSRGLQRTPVSPVQELTPEEDELVRKALTLTSGIDGIHTSDGPETA
jgi:hypothetical protein